MTGKRQSKGKKPPKNTSGKGKTTRKRTQGARADMQTLVQERGERQVCEARKEAEEGVDALIAASPEAACLEMLEGQEERRNLEIKFPESIARKAYYVQKALERRFQDPDLVRSLDSARLRDPYGQQGEAIDTFKKEHETRQASAMAAEVQREMKQTV